MIHATRLKIFWFLIVGFSCFHHWDPAVAWVQSRKRPFTVADDIRLAVFGGSWGIDEELLFSPDGNYFVVESERGRLDLDAPEDTLRFYGCQNVEDFLLRSSGSQTPSPLWVVNRSTDKEGPIIKAWRWLPDSSGLAFLERTSGNNYRLVLADLTRKTVEPLTPAMEAVEQFDIRDRQHFVYTETSQEDRQKLQAQRQEPAVVGTGQNLSALIFNDLAQSAGNHNFYLWAVVGRKTFKVRREGTPIIPGRGLALSPDGGSVVLALSVPEVPPSWPTLYPPPFAADAYRIRVEHGSAEQWVLINLRTSSIQSLTDAPRSPDGTWAAVFSPPSWSSDSKSVLLPGTFLKSKDSVPSRPCIAVVDLASNVRTCVEMLQGRTENGADGRFHHIQEARFVDGDKGRILVRFRRHEDFYSFGTVEYQRTPDGSWRVTDRNERPTNVGRGGLEITLKQGLNEPPHVVARYKQESRVIWDPNPQLKDIELGAASAYTWKDKQGRDWRGGLFKPRDYRPGYRYPLVIQTHGFTESKFIPSGMFPTAFAARELASAGMVVLQVSEAVCPIVTPEEGLCGVSGYEAGAEKLVSEGLVDPERIGIIGFSRTCFPVIQTLVEGSLHVRAASITDGLMASYMQYLLGVQTDWLGKEYEEMIGAQPFGEGLQQWLRRSPGFNLDKVNTPLMVVGEGPYSLLNMWEPYAGLRYLHRPVDLIMLNTHEHVLTNPAARMASQGGSVDWFRFWLQDYEDPDPAKAQQYARWRDLQKSQTKATRQK
jgi:dipeptidyl aminopeptidase/acylaminoacyl peptidase